MIDLITILSVITLIAQDLNTRITREILSCFKNAIHTSKDTDGQKLKEQKSIYHEKPSQEKKIWRCFINIKINLRTKKMIGDKQRDSIMKKRINISRGHNLKCKWTLQQSFKMHEIKTNRAKRKKQKNQKL